MNFLEHKNTLVATLEFRNSLKAILRTLAKFLIFFALYEAPEYVTRTAAVRARYERSLANAAAGNTR